MAENAYLAFLRDPDQSARRAELETFIGPNAAPFMKVYDRLQQDAVASVGGRARFRFAGGGFCVPAFFVGPVWFFYRKMWVIGAVIVGLLAVLAFLPSRAGWPPARVCHGPDGPPDIRPARHWRDPESSPHARSDGLSGLRARRRRVKGRGMGRRRHIRAAGAGEPCGADRAGPLGRAFAAVDATGTMFERFRIKAALRADGDPPARPQRLRGPRRGRLVFYEPAFFVASLMRKRRWTAEHAVVFMVTDVLLQAAQQGGLRVDVREGAKTYAALRAIYRDVRARSSSPQDGSCRDKGVAANRT